MSCHDLALQGFETALAHGGAITNASTESAHRRAARGTTTADAILAALMTLVLNVVPLLTETAEGASVCCRFARGHLEWK